MLKKQLSAYLLTTVVIGYGLLVLNGVVIERGLAPVLTAAFATGFNNL
jgi:hypothetical protein